MLYNNENGNIVVSLSLIFLCLLVLFWVIRLSQGVVSGDVILKEGTSMAVKSAAKQYDDKGKNKGKKDKKNPNAKKPKDKYPVIDPQRAHESFKNILSHNLELDNLQPTKHSAFSEKPRYKLIIYNGNSGIQFDYDGQNTTRNEFHCNGFPEEFTLDESVKVRLSSPGVIAVVQAELKQVAGKKTTYTRWTAAKIVKQKGDYIVVLEKAV